MPKIEPKYVVKPNQEVSTFYSKLNSIQKKAIVLFDADQNGILDEKETKAFNASTFSLKNNGDMDVYLNLSSGKKDKLTIEKNLMEYYSLVLKKRTKESTVKQGEKNIRRITTKDVLAQGLTRRIINQEMEFDGYKLASTDKNGLQKYTKKVEYMVNGKKRIGESYQIYGPTGNLIKTRIINTGDDFEDNFVLTNGDNYCIREEQNGLKKDSYYDEKGILYGSVEQQSDGKLRVADKNNKTLYYTSDKDFRSPSNYRTTYYSADGTPKYKTFHADSPYKEVDVVMLNPDGTETGVVYHTMSDGRRFCGRVTFRELLENPIDEYGNFSPTK